MMPAEDQTRYSSSTNQDYGGHGSTTRKWTPSNSPNGSNGSPDITGNSLNHPGLPQAHLQRNFHQQREMGSANGYGNTGYTKGRPNAGNPNGRPNPSLMFDTGEPLGSLSSSISEAVKTKFIPNREEMKDKLVHALSSDSSIGILPGYKSNGFPGAGFHGHRNAQSTSFLQHDETQQQRLPSPVARARAAVEMMRQEVETTKDMTQGRNSKIAGIFRHPRGDPWVNPSTPGSGHDSISVKKLKQDNYRRDLETQMEQSRMRKEVELKKSREGLEEHPLGSRYNSHSLYTFSREDAAPPSLDKGNKDPKKFSNYLAAKSNSIGQTAPRAPPRKAEADLGVYEANGRGQWPRPPSGRVQGQPPPPRKADPDRASQQSMTGPWLDTAERMSTSSGGQGASHASRDPMGTSGPSGQAHVNTSPRRPQEQIYPPGNPYYPPHPQMSMYPYPYGYPPQPPPQMSYPGYPAQGPAHIQQFQQPLAQQQPPMYPQTHQMAPSSESSMSEFTQHQFPDSESHYIDASFTQQLQRERLLKGNKIIPTSSIEDFTNPEASDCEEMMETAIRQHIWQTSDQLASDDFKKAAFQTVLKKQILQKKKHKEMEREKERVENEKLEQSIQEYQEKMRKQVEAEQEIIKRKLVRNVQDTLKELGNTSKEDDKQKRPQPNSTSIDGNVVGNEEERLILVVNEYDEKPLKVSHKGNTGGGGDAHGHLSKSQVPVDSSPDYRGDPSGGNLPLMVAASRSLPAIAISRFERINPPEANCNPEECPEDVPGPVSYHEVSIGNFDDLTALSHIQNALAGEMRRMKRFMRKHLPVGCR